MKRLATRLEEQPEGLNPLELRGLLTDYLIYYVRRYNTPAKESINAAIKRTSELGLGSKLIPDSIDEKGHLYIQVSGEQEVDVGFEQGKYKPATHHSGLQPHHL